MSEEPDTIDPVEFLRNSAIKWQRHARTTYAVIEIMRDDPANFDADDIIQTQHCYAIESQVARERLWQYLDMTRDGYVTVSGPAW